MDIREVASLRSVKSASFVLSSVIAATWLAGCATTPTLTPNSSSDMAMFELKNYESVQKRPGQNPDITVVVAISGGGYRAANLGLGALLAMEKIPVHYKGQKSNLLREVDYFTTVSGGGFAAGIYLQALLNTPTQERETFELYLTNNPDRLASIQKTLGWPLVGYMVNPRTIGDLDRGDLLQDRLDRTVLKRNTCEQQNVVNDNGKCSWTLGDMFVEAGSGKTPTTPYWITNATNYTNGEVFSFTPDSICSRQVRQYIHLGEPVVTCNDGKLANDVPLALGMRTSSNFPVGIPATTLELESGANIKLSDGGQADNLAFYSALEILYQDAVVSRRQAVDFSDRKKRRILILIDAFKGVMDNSETSSSAPNMVKAMLRPD